ncbi:MAG TPA: DNA-3-methyladenine glycosylase 2 family protein [Acidimicrobiales bacterium]|jgi:DNA-3-methyladenine glycosylase II
MTDTEYPRPKTANRSAKVREAQKHLRKADPVIGRFIERRPDFDPHAWLDDLPTMDLYGALLFQIAGQQLSVAATRRIMERVRTIFGGHLPSPKEVMAVAPDELRAAGFSWRKVNTIRDLAERFLDGRLDMDRLSTLSDDEFIAALTAVPGIGPWTAQGALLVALRREDVVLPGDLALRKAIRTAYDLDHLPSQDEVLELAEKWRPFRSLATSYLFASAYEEGDAS